MFLHKPKEKKIRAAQTMKIPELSVNASGMNSVPSGDQIVIVLQKVDMFREVLVHASRCRYRG